MSQTDHPAYDTPPTETAPNDTITVEWVVDVTIRHRKTFTAAEWNEALHSDESGWEAAQLLADNEDDNTEQAFDVQSRTAWIDGEQVL